MTQKIQKYQYISSYQTLEKTPLKEKGTSLDQWT
jgi:hypothetical protein